MKGNTPCGRKVVGEGLCVLHLPRQEGQAEGDWATPTFITALSDALARPNIDGLVDLSGVHFPRIDFTKFEWRYPTLFSGAIFQSNLNLSDVIFENDVDFSSANFIGGISGGKALFKGDANFCGAQIDGFRLDGLTFLGAADFSKIRLEVDSWMTGCDFLGPARFAAASLGELYLQGTQFKGGLDCDDLRARILSFDNVVVSGSASFRRVTFGYKVEWPQQFPDVTFDDAVFPNPADYRRCVLGGNASFARARFDAAADFSGCHFGSDVTFTGAMFSGEADFARTRYTRGVSFVQAVFAGRFDFSRAQLLNGAGIADFSAVKFEERSRVHFVQVNNETASGARLRLADTELEQVRFERVRWHRENGRIVLQDELDVRTGEAVGPDAVAVAYRRLLVNFERSHLHDEAQDCLWGVMEMRRRVSEDWFVASALNVYRVASFYGSSPRRALGVLLFIVLLLFPLLYTLPQAGLTEVGQPSVGGGAGSTTPPAGQLQRALNRWRQGLLHSLEVSTFRSAPWFTTTLSVGHVVTTVQTVVVPIQVALTLLAFRRRFAR